jgi:indolepyruvate ferredoxin oxidoreductase
MPDQTFEVHEQAAEAASPQYLDGISALVSLLVEQMHADKRRGWNTAAFVSGYPGSPLAGFDLEMRRQRRLLEDNGIRHQPGLNEELAATAVFGSQVASATEGFRHDGVLGVWYGKAPGLDRAADAVRHGNHLGTDRRSGVILLVGDDPGCKSSSLPSASESLCAALQLPVLHPADSQDLVDLGHHAIALSRFSGLWTAMKIVADVADSSGPVDTDPHRISTIQPQASEPLRPLVPRLHRPFSLDMQREIVTERLQRARQYSAANDLNRTAGDTRGSWLGIVASGHTYLNVVEALRLLGLASADLTRFGIRLMQVRQLFPLDPGGLRRFASGLEELVVVEEYGPFLELYVRDALYGMTDAPRVLGKADSDGLPLVSASGALSADSITGPIRRRVESRIDPARLQAPVAQRKTLTVVASREPWFCSGCPHSTSTKVPPGTLVGTGIGCHALASRMDPDRVGTVLSNTQMGGEGAQWIGAAPFLEQTHIVQNMGDGTLAHSGWLSIRFAVAAGSHITFKLLFNDAIAMTGGQEPLGLNSVPRVASALLAEGVSRIIVTTDQLSNYRHVGLPRGVEIWDRKRLIEAQEVLANVPAVTVLIHDQKCAAELRRARKRGVAVTPSERVLINERVCEGCGDCGMKSGCLSVQTVQTDYGPKAAIHQSSCNFDYSCLEGDCPSFVLVTRARATRFLRYRRSSSRDAHPSPPSVRDLEQTAFEDEYVVRLPGVGGTGVVTVSRILATAAMADGYKVIGLDQTGLSQKAGPVVSDIRIATGAGPRPAHSPDGRVDLYLALDPLVSLAPDYTRGLSDHTNVVGSTSWNPPGSLIGKVKESFAQGENVRGQLESIVGRTGKWVDAERLAGMLTGSAATANVLLLGVAYQMGLLPISVSSIEAAIEQNGTAVSANLSAFRWGRAVVEMPDSVPSSTFTRATASEGPVLPEQIEKRIQELALDGPTRELIDRRTIELIAYQSVRYASRFISTLETAARSAHAGFIAAVADNLYKLMAYKDEYEVARLHTDARAREKIKEIGGPGARATVMLHPPLLRSLGWQRKIRFGPASRPVLSLLARARWLRGTPLDLFGLTELRRTERRLIAEYELVISTLSEQFRSDEAERFIRIAGLPQQISGYEEIKQNAIRQYELDLQAGLGELGIVLS